ncbi:MAG: bifunctional DNA primase/polymerase, partial [Chloroflexota bacterium]|nr:bifunctional DNA primase/polymerase [Chloroflexota bacterium]
LLLRVPPDCEIRNSSARLAPGVDVRGDGGYLVVTPSVHPLGRPYRWVRGQSPWECALLPLPDALIHTLTRAGSATRPPQSERTAALLPAVIPTGQRNTTLLSLAGTMRRRNFSPAAILAALLVENTSRCTPPLPVAEVQRIVHNICRYPPG